MIATAKPKSVAARPFISLTNLEDSPNDEWLADQISDCLRTRKRHRFAGFYIGRIYLESDGAVLVEWDESSVFGDIWDLADHPSYKTRCWKTFTVHPKRKRG